MPTLLLSTIWFKPSWIAHDTFKTASAIDGSICSIDQTKNSFNQSTKEPFELVPDPSNEALEILKCQIVQIEDHLQEMNDSHKN